MDASLGAKRLILKLTTPAELRAKIAELPPELYAEISPEWLARIEAADAPDPWVHGFDIVRNETNEPVGQCGFKGPPRNGAVEIAFAIDPAHQGQGYATEAVAALTGFAFSDPRVTIVRAHTLPDINASTQALCKCNFRHIGEVIDPEDGLVWRWEKLATD